MASLWVTVVMVFAVRGARAQSVAPKERFEKYVRAYEAVDALTPAPRDAILLVGDSQFYRWTTFREDLAGYTVVNRGVDSFQLSDVLQYTDRLVLPYRPRLIVLHVGGNDVHNGKAPEQVLADFKAFVGKVRAVLPNVVIAFTSITPSPGRWSEAEVRKRANALVSEYVATEAGLRYIDLWDAMLTVEGKPREDIWVQDRVHPNHEGYLIRVKAMKEVLGRQDGLEPQPSGQVWSDRGSWDVSQRSLPCHQLQRPLSPGSFGSWAAARAVSRPSQSATRR